MTTQLDSGNRTVLIVDDDEIYRQVLALGLEDAGYRTLTAENGERAVELVTEKRPDLILLDMLRPVMDGMQFLRWAKQKGPAPVPTIVLTCLDRRAVVVEALMAGAKDVLTKPFSLPELIRKLSTLS